jgi:hypothetical protein
MLRAGGKSVLFFIILLVTSTCIDPYIPILAGYESLLVVDGLVTDQPGTYSVKLSRTMQEARAVPDPVYNASVFITDDANNRYSFHNSGKGEYKSYSSEFTGIPGRKYTLHIITGEGVEYESEACSMHPVPDIDSIYFSSAEELVNNGTESQKGIRIFLDTESGTGKYFRWSYEETWKFSIPNPKMYDYFGERSIIRVPVINQFCWKKNISDDIVVHSGYAGQSGGSKRIPVLFIASDKSDRLNIRYSILIKQYSISEHEFSFWNNLKKINDNGGDIFASQPYPVFSNIHNIDDPQEKVLGYFQVSAVTEKRIFISYKDIAKMHLPYYYNYSCERIEASPADYSMPWGAPATFDDVYSLFCITSNYVFIEPLYDPLTGNLDKLVFSRPECANCEFTGTMTEPDFWKEAK